MNPLHIHVASLLALATVCCHAAGGRAGAVITVKSGRQVSLRPSDLAPLPAAAPCRVQLQFDHMSQRVGHLEPTIFNCNFTEGSVLYKHSGSPLLNEDILRFKIYSANRTHTIEDSVFVTLEVIQASYDVIFRDRLRDVQVNEFYQLSEEVDTSVLRFKYNYYNGASCAISFVRNKQRLPLVGNLVQGVEGRAVDTALEDCRTFLYSGYRYEHLRPPTPEIDFIPLQVEVHEANEALPQVTERFFLPVHLQDAKANSKPAFNTRSPRKLQVKVKATGFTILEPDVISASDAETLNELLVFNVSIPPLEGRLVHLEQQQRHHVTNFLQADLLARLIAYQPPDETHQLKLRMQLTAIDSYFQTSEPLDLDLILQSRRDEDEFHVVSNNLVVMEGQTTVITTSALNATAADLNHLIFKVKGGLRHGVLLIKDQSVDSFNMLDVVEGKVSYQHDGGEAKFDKILFRTIYKPTNTLLKTKLRVEIIQLDDSAPALVINDLLECSEGGQVQLNDDLLRAHDKDTDDDLLKFFVQVQPLYGIITRKVREYTKGHQIAVFTQKQLQQGLIYYEHRGGSKEQDEFTIQLSDVAEPANFSPQYKVIISVSSSNDMPPLQVAGTSRHLSVSETRPALITPTMLHYENSVARPSQIVYTLTEQPFFLTTTITVDAGKIVRAKNASTLVKRKTTPATLTFTQQDIDFGRVAYMPPMADIGSIKRHARFIFSVHDQTGSSLLDQAFDVTINPVNNQVPHLRTRTVHIEEGGSIFLNKGHLRAYDPDTPIDQLVMVLDSPPKYGELLKGSLRMVEGEEFNMDDIEDSLIEYRHDGSEVEEDSITLSVTDGSNKLAKVLLFKVSLVHDANPKPLHNLQNSFSVRENEEYLITSKHVAATDNDTNDAEINFIIIRAPHHGEIQVKGHKSDSFKQKNIWQKEVRYVHTDGEIGLIERRDSITFAVTDSLAPGRNGVSLIDLNVTIVPVNNGKPEVVLGAPLMVREGGKVVISADVLTADDVDTPNSNLKFVVEKSPEWGQLEVANQAVKEFSLLDIKRGNLMYNQNHHAGVEPLSDAFQIVVSDGEMTSESETVVLNVIPQNDEKPHLQLRDIEVKEGGEIDLGRYIFFEDADKPSQQLHLLLDRKPLYGKLVLRDVNGDHALHNISVSALESGAKLVYKHDNSEHLVDEYAFKLTDGLYSDKQRASVFVFGVNDEAPKIEANLGQMVEAGGRVVISGDDLLALDPDNDAKKISYVIDAVPERGNLQIMRNNQWNTIEKGFTFNQEEINNKRLRYVHTHSNSELHTDRFLFRLTDGRHTTTEDQFSFIILSREHNRGRELDVVNNVVEVDEMGVAPISSNELSAADGQTPSNKVTFTVTEFPQYGKLLLDGRPNVEIFSQKDVLDGRLEYQHKTKKDFKQDGVGLTIKTPLNMSKVEQLVIVINSKEEELPSVDVKVPLTVVQGENVVILPSHLHVSDFDTADDDIIYRITDLPKYGFLFRAGEIINNFTQDEVNNGLVSYQSEQKGEFDFFHYTVSDGTHDGYLLNGTRQSKPLFYSILIQPLANEPPVIQANVPPQTLEDLGNQRQGFIITNKHLRVAHPKYSANQIIYTVLTKPENGFLEAVDTGRPIKRKFTQADIDARRVLYVLSPTSKSSNDSFLFRVEDANRNRIDNQLYTMEWPVVDLEHAQYIVCEDVGVIGIRLIRSGFLEGVSTVNVKVKSISARNNADFMAMSEEPVMFEPGAHSATWGLKIINDGIPEGNEKLKVMLKDPINVILGKVAKSRVQIVDFNHGECVEYIGMFSKTNPRGNLVSYSGEERKTHYQKPKTNYGDSMVKDDTYLKRTRKHKQIGEIGSDKSKQDLSSFDIISKQSLHFTDREERKPNPEPEKKLPTFMPTVDYPVRVPQACTTDKKGLLFYDIFSSKLYRCNGFVWQEWNKNRMFEVDFQPVQKATYTNVLLDEPQNLHQAKKERNNCPNGWVLHGGRCYLVVKEKATWSQARGRCERRHKAELVTIYNEETNMWLWSAAKRRPFWIGFHKQSDIDTWSFNTSQRRQSSQYTRWKRGFPRASKHKRKNCAYVAKGGFWKNTHCNSYRRRYVCVS